MRKVVSVAEHILFCLNVLIIFLLVFEHQLVLPSWLQVFGRMHPMFLHFPIVVLLLAAVLYFYHLYNKELVNEELVKKFILLGALTASLTIVMGLFLSLEGGYTGDIMQLHKWLGVLAGVLATGWYYLVSGHYHITLGKISAGLITLSLLLAGHFGAQLTHGEDFLFAPFHEVGTDKVVPFDEALIYDHVVASIINEKCASCHNPSKAKGNLILTSEEGIVKGGKEGKLFEEGKPLESLLMKRIHLPLEDKKHMPPKNKAQLTESEEEILTYWIKSGVDFRKKVIDLPAGDTLRTLLERRIQPVDEEEVYTFTAADEKTIRNLNTAYRVVEPIAIHSPALFVNIYNAAGYSSKQLDELSPVSKQIVSLDLTKMPVTDEDIKIISQFENLRRLNLNFTEITGIGLSALNSLKHLEYLSLSSTKVRQENLTSLSNLGKLKRLYIWNTSLSQNEIKDLQSNLKNVFIETGFVPDHSKMLRLPPARIDNDKKIYTSDFLITIRHPVKGAIVRYTLDGSEPDSINSPVYEKPIPTSSSITSVMTKAYKDGWRSSEITSATFYKASYRPDSIIMLTFPEKKYFAKGAETLMDGESGDVSYGSREGWLGYRKDPMETIIEFKEPVSLQSVTLSTNCNVGAFIFPASRIQIWGGKDKNNMTLLSSIQPDQPKGYVDMQRGLTSTFRQQQITYMRILAEPVSKLPSWHSNKGEKGWLFVDEILFN